MSHSIQLLLRIDLWAAAISLFACQALSWNGFRTSCVGYGRVRSACMFMTDPARDSSLKAFDVQAVDTPTFPSGSREIANSKSSKAAARRRKPQRQRKPPAVDSTLLRFIRQQKDFLVSVPLPDYNEETNRPKQQSPTPRRIAYETMVEETVLEYSSPLTELPANPTTIEQSENQDMSVSSAKKELISNDDEGFFNVSDSKLQNENVGWGQYNSHRVESVLLSMDESLDKTSVAKAGARVQAQVLARTIRRRIRTYLKQRDQSWRRRYLSNPLDPSAASRSTEKDTVAAADSMKMMMMIENGYAPDLSGHTLEESMEVMTQHGLTAKDITEILHHSPGVVLMRPRGISLDGDVDISSESSSSDGDSVENGECLDDTLDRVFKLLCVTLKLRKYDARKIVRSSPGLLTMRGSKSAEAMVALFHRMGVSYNAIARDKAALSITLLRSPSAIFRLVAFLASDAIRMPVGKIGPLLRRPLARDLLNVVAPIPQQSMGAASSIVNSTESGAETPDAPREALESDLDPWIVSALWGKQSQIRRDQTNNIYQQMTKTAWTLRNEIGTADLSKVVSAYPSVLLLDAENQILPNAEYLMEDLGICEGDLPRVLQLYPVLLGLPIEQMDGVARYVESLGVEHDNLSSMFRAFPALLTLDIDEDIKPVVEFLHSIGVVDIGRFLTRIPPVLGYSVEKELMPKWKHLKKVSSDARFEVTKFPAYFSYPLERVIKARYDYVKHVKRFPTQLINVEKVVSYGDYDFATKVLRDSDDGREFFDFLEQRKKTFQAQKRTRKKPRTDVKQEERGEETIATGSR